MSRIRALVLTGFGLNCDIETAYALKKAGARAERIHLNHLIDGVNRLKDFQIFVIGGGFSWGDDHGAGVILAMRLKHRLQDDILNFVQAGGLVLGICNGFQVIVNLGLLPGFEPHQLRRDVAIIGNDCGNFRDQWVRLGGNPASPCILTRGIDTIELPVRHGEGKFYAETGVLERLVSSEQVILRYTTTDGRPAAGEFPDNPNGSLGDIAGICDPTGRIAGLMPHPEAFNHCTNHPDWTYRKEVLRRQGKSLPEEGDGIKMFRNLVDYFA
ncbi:phosphoribosylformylglycinamidine synthase subunit PurQ [Desulfoferrobacter suflitae]|uniref:phosphoribosylformylglycinamidine synthase subunit PurQ n=1 Tax=Desulfoferrobacter suflitae TaxID=2865782 RepID=UPI002164D482|nr:phosphoribosylformylglycinamidine synthase subunit PurQ [Desulfoferrobacter suflitae]MCK8602540.1 phosphoribosylformylglycinamidine synthase subunit PurQ [Desulfoferrobacter suflitae]